MRVSQVIEALKRLPQDSEIAVDWATKSMAEKLVNRIISDFDWECAVYDWEFTDFEDFTDSVAGQVAPIVDNIAIARDENAAYGHDLGGRW